MVARIIYSVAGMFCIPIVGRTIFMFTCPRNFAKLP